MKPPKSRHGKLARLANPPPAESELASLASRAKYLGSPKHKLNPHAFDLGDFAGQRGDATLCDRDAYFTREHSRYIPNWMERGIKAGLVSGDGSRIWAVADTGWIFEGRVTIGFEYHGFPLMPGDPSAEIVYDRFKQWVECHPKQRHRNAVSNCASLYGFKP